MDSDTMARRAVDKRYVRDVGNLVDSGGMDDDESEEERKRARKGKL